MGWGIRLESHNGNNFGVSTLRWLIGQLLYSSKYDLVDRYFWSNVEVNEGLNSTALMWMRWWCLCLLILTR